MAGWRRAEDEDDDDAIQLDGWRLALGEAKLHFTPPPASLLKKIARRCQLSLPLID
jgi:hypothetical protein